MNILKLYKKITGYRDRDRSKLYITPFREWSIVLFINIIFVFVFVFFSYYSFNDIYVNGFRNEVDDQVKIDPYKIKSLRTELSEMLQYYQEREYEHNILLEKQPLFENQINIASSSDVYEVYNIEDDDGVASSTDEILPKFNQIESRFLDTASVWKALFVDPSK